VFRTRSPVTGGVTDIDLSLQGEHPRIHYDAQVDGYQVWAFSDFKRHDMGPENAARHVEGGVGESVYLTRRLWGLAGSGPYMYDGHAPWFDHAIAAHGGEADPSRQAFSALDNQGKADVRVFLLSLRRQPRPIVP